MTTPDIRQLGRADLDAITPAQFAAMVKGASKSDLDDLMGDADARGKVLDAVFARMSGRYKGGRPSSQVVHWKIQGGPGGEDVYETVLDPSECTVAAAPERTPDVTISLSGQDFLKLAAGVTAPPMMFLTGKLKVAGDVGLAAALGTLFDIPKA